MKSDFKTWLKNYCLTLFFLMAYMITFLLSFIGTSDFMPIPLPSWLKNLALVLLHHGPALAAIIISLAIGGKARLSSLLAKFRIGGVVIQWYLFVIFFPVCLALLAVGIELLIGGKTPSFFSGGGGVVPAGNVFVNLILVVLAVFFQAGLAEEIGWRGFALPLLQSRFNALVSSLILGLVWAFWHFHPVNLPHLTPVWGWYVFTVVMNSILYTWIFNNTRGSLSMVVLFHTSQNVSEWIVPLSSIFAFGGLSRLDMIHKLLMLIFVITMVILFGAENLSHSRGIQENS